MVITQIMTCIMLLSVFIGLPANILLIYLIINYTPLSVRAYKRVNLI